MLTFLDVALLACVVYMICLRKPAVDGGFDRQTTAVIRGVAMIGIVLHHIGNGLGLASPIMFSVGYLATGVFFFISGYGNTLSIDKCTKVNITWLTKKLSKILLPFFIFFVLFYITAFDRPDVKSALKELIRLNTPTGGQCWFIKIILFCFIIHFISALLFKSKKWRCTVLFILTVIYILAAYYFKLSNEWFNSVLCYPLGAMCTYTFANKTIKKKELLIWGALFLVSFYLVNHFYQLAFCLGILCALLFSLFCFVYGKEYHSESPLLEWIGNNSFEFFLFQMIPLHILKNTKDFLYGIPYALGILILTGLIVWLYKKLFQIIKSIKYR